MGNNMKGGNTLLNINLTIISLVIVFYILYIGASLLIPFVVALILAFALISIYSFFKNLIKNSFFSFLLTFLLCVGITWVIFTIIDTNIQDIVQKSSFYQDQLRFIIDKYVAKFGFNEGEFYEKVWSYIDLQTIFTNMATFLTSMFSYIGVTFFYLIFILLEYKFFTEKISLMMENETQKKEIVEIIHKIKKDIKTYFVIKIFISLISAFFYYIVMKSVGLDFALFWSFLMFILNFIPNIGSVIAIIFPLGLSLIQFDNFYGFFVIIISALVIETVMGNIVEPKMTGNKLNLSPLVILLSLVFWGSIWGIIGMLLAVPIMVIINIILSKFDQTRPIAILLSEKGDVKNGVDIDLLPSSGDKMIKKARVFFYKMYKKLK